MISAKEARSLMLANASFERKVELYNQVTKIINEAVEGKKNTFDISEEQHLVLNKELLEKVIKKPTKVSLLCFLSEFRLMVASQTHHQCTLTKFKENKI